MARRNPNRPHHRLQRRRWGRIAFAVTLTIILIAGLMLLAGAILIRRYDNALTRATLLAPNARAGDAAVSGPLNYLLIGSDYRRWSPDAGQRSDTIIVAHVPKTMDHVYLISVPRDLLVNMRPVPELGFAGATTKINAAFEFGRGGDGGTQILSQTLSDLAGVRFDGAAIVSFTGLTRAVDVVGGVQLCIDVRTVSVHTGAVFEPGCRVMQSKEVLDYLRQRNFPDGDFARQRHQQQFLKAFLDQMTSAGVLANPLKLDSLMRAVGSAVTIDTGGVSVPDLVLALRDVRPSSVTGIKIPSYLDNIDNVSYVIASAEAGSLFAAIRDDTLSAWVAEHRNWVNTI